MPVSAQVSTASGQTVLIAEGDQIVFGRGPEVDLAIAVGRGLSRRAGIVTAMAAGAWIVNISHTHALYVEGEGYRIRLPRLEDDGEPAGGWLLHSGTALVGSRAMLDDDLPLTVTVTSEQQADGSARTQPDGEGTVLPFYLDPMTKLFLVALIWCRPWLVDSGATTPLPRTPEIARSALQVTGAYHELERFDADPEFRDLLSARVAEHIKVLRRKIADRGLTPRGGRGSGVEGDVRLSDEVAVRILIEHGIITSADLRLLTDPAWRSRQEDLWWTQGLGIRPYGTPGGSTMNSVLARWPPASRTSTVYSPSCSERG
jgi:hypothetical protein